MIIGKMPNNSSNDLRYNECSITTIQAQNSVTNQLPVGEATEESQSRFNMFLTNVHQHQQ